MTTHEREPYPFVTKVIDLFGDWLKQRRELNELTEFAADPGELERVARELNVSGRLELLQRVIHLRPRDLGPLPHMSPLQLGPELVAVHGPLTQKTEHDKIGERQRRATRHAQECPLDDDSSLI